MTTAGRAPRRSSRGARRWRRPPGTRWSPSPSLPCSQRPRGESVCRRSASARALCLARSAAFIARSAVNLANSCYHFCAHQHGSELSRIYILDMAKARSLSNICFGAHWPWPQSACAWFAAHSCAAQRSGHNQIGETRALLALAGERSPLSLPVPWTGPALVKVVLEIAGRPRARSICGHHEAISKGGAPAAGWRR